MQHAEENDSEAQIVQAEIREGSQAAQAVGHSHGQRSGRLPGCVRVVNFTPRPMFGKSAEDAPAMSGAKVTLHAHFRHARLGVWCVRRGMRAAQAKAFREWKAAPVEHDAFTQAIAADIVGLVLAWQPAIRPDWIITVPPSAASAGRPYPAGFLGVAVAKMLDLDFVTTLARSDCKRWHGRHYSIKQEPFIVTVAPPSVADVSTAKEHPPRTRGRVWCARGGVGLAGQRHNRYECRRSPS